MGYILGESADIAIIAISLIATIRGIFLPLPHHHHPQPPILGGFVATSQAVASLSMVLCLDIYLIAIIPVIFLPILLTSWVSV